MYNELKIQHCPILMENGNRCFCLLQNEDFCKYHGNIKEARELYFRTGTLTKEQAVIAQPAERFPVEEDVSDANSDNGA
jgi:hypothetical protein